MRANKKNVLMGTYPNLLRTGSALLLRGGKRIVHVETGEHYTGRINNTTINTLQQHYYYPTIVGKEHMII